VPEEAVKAVPRNLAFRLEVMPIYLEGRHLRVALADPFNFDAIDTLSKELRYDIDPVVAPEDQILMITSGNQVIRLKVGDIRKTGRDAKGVRLQRLGQGDEVIAITNLGKQAKQITEITGEPQQTEL